MASQAEEKVSTGYEKENITPAVSPKAVTPPGSPSRIAALSPTSQGKRTGSPAVVRAFSDLSINGLSPTALSDKGDFSKISPARAYFSDRAKF